MINDYNFIYDTNQLENKISDTVEKYEAEKIIDLLAAFLIKQQTSPAICAPQIGLFKQVLLVHYDTGLFFLVNPVIIEQKYPIPYLEACITYPNELIETMRYASIRVKSDNFKEPIKIGINGKFDNTDDRLKHPAVSLAAYIQQGIDFFNGVLPKQRLFDSMMKAMQPNITPTNIIDGETYRRNEVVELEKNGLTISIKFKKIKQYIDDGWQVIKKQSNG
jgi:peptide deformylase